MRSVFASPDAVAAELVHLTADAARAAIAARGRFTMALTGGSAATTLYPVLAQAPLPWEHVHVFYGDERCVPPDHNDSNHRLAVESFLSRVKLPDANVHRMRGEDADVDAAARSYERELLACTDGTGALDVIHVGMGPDGHVFSLFPGHALLREEVRLVAPITDSPKPPSSRITLTLQAASRARSLWYLVAGASKAEAVARVLLDPTCGLPAAQLQRRGRHVRWLLDQDAARLVK